MCHCVDLRIFANQTTCWWRICKQLSQFQVLKNNNVFIEKLLVVAFSKGHPPIYEISMTPLMLVLCPSWLHIYCCHYYVYYCHFAQCHIPILFLPRRQWSLISSEGRGVVVHQSLELQMRVSDDFIITEKARTQWRLGRKLRFGELLSLGKWVTQKPR